MSTSVTVLSGQTYTVSAGLKDIGDTVESGGKLVEFGTISNTQDNGVVQIFGGAEISTFITAAALRKTMAGRRSAPP
jgi:hypothetical protein